MTATTPTGTEAALLREVCERPFEDGPRLVYADWCDEHGDYERAAFIRMQISGDETATPLPHWVAPMMADIGVSLSKRFPDSVAYDEFGTHSCQSKYGEIRYDWSRGFPSSVSLTLAQLCGGQCAYDLRAAGGFGARNIPCARTTCKKCNGTGRTPGLAGQLARRPVTEVRFTDRLRHFSGPNFGEFWLPAMNQSKHILDLDYDGGREMVYINGNTSHRNYVEQFVPKPHFKTEKEARDYDSRRAVSIIRSRANPPLGEIRWPS